MTTYEVFVHIDYLHDLDDNLGVLINTLLDKYRQFIDLSMY